MGWGTSTPTKTSPPRRSGQDAPRTDGCLSHRGCCEVGRGCASFRSLIMENRPTSCVLAQAGWETQRLRRFALSPLILRILIQTNITRARRSRFTSRHKIVDYGKSTYNPFLNPFVGARFPRPRGLGDPTPTKIRTLGCPPSCPDVSAVLFLRITHHVSG